MGVGRAFTNKRLRPRHACVVTPFQDCEGSWFIKKMESGREGCDVVIGHKVVLTNVGVIVRALGKVHDV